MRNHSPNKPAPMSRVFSLSSKTGTPRSSTEIGSTSNHSEDTVVSEYIANPTSRLLGRSETVRQSSQLLAQNARRRLPEALMMGFVQVSGSFTLDESLVNQMPFEEVKQKAVLGSQAGGGVVGIEKPKSAGNLFGGFSWGNIGESLGGFLRNSEPSSMREMKGIASSKSIPLLSTPKSILFVDLKLGPGESRSYRYKIALPRGLPPSHKGRAIRVVYNLVVGLQRPQGRNSREQQIRQVGVPFRVFCGVNYHGESLGHDLMSPYIVLKDSARTEDLHGQLGSRDKARFLQPDEICAQSSEGDFNDYVLKLLENPRRNSTTSLLSPTAEPEQTPNGTTLNGMISPITRLATRDLVENAIRYSTQPVPSDSAGASSATSQTHFTIARAGQPVAHLSVSRPALRLGDVLQLVIDFPSLSPMNPDTACPGPFQNMGQSLVLPVYALAATLESIETVDPTLAIRSRSSIERATRRIWDRRVSGGANAMALGWSRRWAGTLKVPTQATPGFTTTAVGLSWYVRVEIIVEAGRSGARSHLQEYDSDGEDDGATGNEVLHTKGKHGKSTNPRRTRADALLEQLSEDGRGSVMAAARRLGCESFEVMVPVRVFGAAGVVTKLDDEVSGAAEEGLIL